jgi:N-acetyltransferase
LWDDTSGLIRSYMKQFTAHDGYQSRRRLQAARYGGTRVLLLRPEWRFPWDDSRFGLQVSFILDIVISFMSQPFARAYPGAARVSSMMSECTLTALTHMMIFVQPHGTSNQTYLVDVGFGPSGPARPILLSDADDNVVQGANPTEMHRLTRKPHPLSSLGTSAALPKSPLLLSSSMSLILSFAARNVGSSSPRPQRLALESGSLEVKRGK